MSFDSYSPKNDSDLSDEESNLLSRVFGEESSSCDECNSDNTTNSGSKDHKCKDKKSKDNKSKDGWYDCSYWTIFIAIIFTLIFLILACPAADIFFSAHVPDPWFNWITRGLIFFFFAFIILIVFEYYHYGPKHSDD